MTNTKPLHTLAYLDEIFKKKVRMEKISALFTGSMFGAIVMRYVIEHFHLEPYTFILTFTNLVMVISVTVTLEALVQVTSAEGKIEGLRKTLELLSEDNEERVRSETSIENFTAGQMLTRIAPSKPYQITGNGDRSYMGDCFELMNIDANFIWGVLHDSLHGNGHESLKLARDVWSEGWALFTEPAEEVCTHELVDMQRCVACGDPVEMSSGS